MDMTNFFASAWKQYVEISPAVGDIHDQVEKKFGKVVNDHIALRTVDCLECNMKNLSGRFERMGYTLAGDYFFEKKKLRAVHLDKDGAAKVFISELMTDSFSPGIGELFRGLPPVPGGDWPFFATPRWWHPSFEMRNKILDESEYAAWFYTFGIVPNHFTVAVHELGIDLDQVNDFLLDEGHKLNESGGMVKGTRESGLRQSSTMAAMGPVAFQEGEFQIPTVYYEFAERSLVDGTLFGGFQTNSADKIFESTNQG